MLKSSEIIRKKYMLKKIASFINVDIGVLLSFKTCKENKIRIMYTIKRIKEKSNDAYKYSKNKTLISVLILSNYKIYLLLSLLKRLKK